MISDLHRIMDNDRYICFGKYYIISEISLDPYSFVPENCTS